MQGRKDPLPFSWSLSHGSPRHCSPWAILLTMFPPSSALNISHIWPHCMILCNYLPGYFCDKCISQTFPCMPLCYVLQVRDKAVKETWNKSRSQHKSTVTQVEDAYLAATQCSCCLPPSWDISPVSSFLSCHCFCVSFRILCPDLP